jgi:hypothetical protein
MNMRVRIAYTIDVSDEYRRAIREYYGQEGLATREEIKNWWREYGESMNENLALGRTRLGPDDLAGPVE